MKIYSSKTKLTRQELKNPYFCGKFRVEDFDTSDNEATIIPASASAMSLPLFVYCDRVMKVGEVVEGYLNDHPARNPGNLRFIEAEK
ncbi:MAG: hypothetical protein CLLPBCKN_003360 [Chroococcidiopsis cubana SAG 39.79]|uniref:Uncharacterized protein n=1 Tax=Chroococcidiopsis cubana SAG 39.79 TaxID=388085 RepID=A0AB37U908_9CYAN|nr:hypothetical protein [Chroococcidiopsis cubana]MDZ4873964.1 hypothetical protein [Chroococcidiopsis cubana SAG 39.79]PSB59674.1 hypothetical protein C7B79_28590 [Chroococcidiopsis cubana CCALA 043]RUT00476.1 hypothetical protein DSM107010_67840 [Chroococcidiopsis cubana SAG 39.79]